MKPKDVKTAPLRAYGRVWWRLTMLQFQQQVANARLAAVFFIVGKLFRLFSAFLFIYVIISKTHALVGYTLPQAVLILALFNFNSTFSQLFFRGVYLFRQKIVNGDFDFYLLNPLSELFYSLFSYTDPLDLLLIIPYGGIVFWAWHYAGYSYSILNILLLLVTLIISSLFVFSLHVIVVSIGIRYLEVDNTIMLYRDLEKMAAYPIEIYGRVGEFIFTYLLPFTLLATTPARFIFGLSPSSLLLYFLPLSLVFVFSSLSFWRHSLKSYSSASS
jgi:ABC-2 type transport system permease protein